MSRSESPAAPEITEPSIATALNGPLLVNGGLPLYRRRAVESEYGEPLTWETTERIETPPSYRLCRCGASTNKPFCDAAHAKAGFTANDTASGTYAERSKELGGTHITVTDDRSICVHAGFCGTRVTNVWKEVGKTEESTVRVEVIGMVERCPSGALTYRFDGEPVEPLLPQAISVTDDGPLWVTGNVAITSSDGTPLETRNRVTLCRCGASANKPLCDGSHKAAGFTDH